MEPAFKRLAIETAGLVLRRMSQSEAFKIFLATELTPEQRFSSTGGATPVVTGLRRIFTRKLKEFETCLASYIKDWPHGRRGNRHARPFHRDKSDNKFSGKAFQFLFAPSGAGKTTSVFERLTCQYGYYMVSCALPKHSNTPAIDSGYASGKNAKQRILDPKVLRGVSADTRELFTMFNYVLKLGLKDEKLGQFDLYLTCRAWWCRILETRHIVYDCFRETLEDRANPGLWLSFQLNCDEWDPFLQIFRVVSLFSNYTFPVEGSKDIDPIGFGQHLSSNYKQVQWACVDEAQEDLQIELGEISYFSLNLLRAALETLSSLKVGRKFFHVLSDGGYFQQVVFSGTSLNVSKLLPVVEEILNEEEFHNCSRKELRTRLLEMKNPWVPINDSHVMKDQVNVDTSFPLVMSKAAMEEVLETYGLDARCAVDHGRSLWGRVKWTAMYAERVIEELKKDKKTDFSELSQPDYQREVEKLVSEKHQTLNFDNLAEQTYETVVEELCLRLGMIQKRPGGGKLLDALLEAAISADILNRPHVFHKESEMQLVEDGFAILESRLDQLEVRLNNFQIIEKTSNHLTVNLSEKENIENIEDGITQLMGEVHKGRFTIVGCETERLTRDMLKNGFTIVDCAVGHVATRLESEGFIVSNISKNELTVKVANTVARGGVLTECRLENLAKTVWEDFEVKEYTTVGLTTTMVENGFTVWGDQKRNALESLLNEANCVVEKDTKYQLTARLKDGVSIEDKTTEKITTELKNKKFVILNLTREQLVKQAEDGLTIRLRHKDTNFRESLRHILAKRGFSLTGTDNLLMAKLENDTRSADLGSAIDTDKLLGFEAKHRLVIAGKTKEELEELIMMPLTIVAHKSSELTEMMLEEGCTVWGQYERFLAVLTSWEVEYGTVKGLTFIKESENQFTMRIAWQDDMRIPDLKIFSAALLEHGFILVDRSKTSLVATLAERVVIDAIIRFCIGSRLEQRFIHVFRLVSTRTGLGHGAEHLLAVVSL